MEPRNIQEVPVFDIIIVEDKKITREGLMRLIDWRSIGGYAAACFAGANDAIQYIDHHHVDLIVTDIAMPDGSGLDLLRYVHAKRAEIQVIIISAYEKFSYAHEALSLGASAYLLKPVNSEELLLHAKRAFEEIESHRLAMTQQSFLQWSRLADEVSHFLFDGAKGLLAEHLQEMQEAFKVSGSVFLYLRCYGDFHADCRRLREIANETGQPLFLFPTGADLCGVLSGALPASDEVLDILQRQWQLHRPYRLGVSRPASSLEDWPAHFAQARAALLRGFWQEEEAGIHRCWEEPKPGAVHPSPHLDFAELKKDLWADDFEAARQHLDQVLALCRDSCSDSHRIAVEFEDILTRLYDANQLADAAPAGTLRRLDGCSSGTALRAAMIALLEACFLRVSAQKEQIVRPIVKLALEYAIQHINEPDLNLKSIAQKMGVSYVYLSKAFREDFQKRFSEYIALYRIELAKDYLLEPHAHVYEVCAKVGLEPKNFHGLFKRYTGMTPKTYQARNVHYEKGNEPEEA